MDERVSAVVAVRSTRERVRQQAMEVHATLEGHIDQGRLKPGERLATERDLAKQFGASRSAVRNALASLHQAGKIDRKVGHGTVVLASTKTEGPGARFLIDTSPSELMEFRLALEPGLAESIVLNASERDMAAILACVESGERAEGWEEWERWDSSFHLSLVAATHNRLSIQIYDAIVGIRHEKPWIKLKRSHTDAQNWQFYQQQHQSIAEALVKRDANKAADLLRDHLLHARRKMLGSDI